MRDAGAGEMASEDLRARSRRSRATLGLPYVGGDVFLDGSIGSGTAAVSEPYHDRGGYGHLMHGDAEVEAYFAAAEGLGISAGVHAIGDRAIEQCIATWEKVLGGKPSPRNRHFIEHFEIATPRADRALRAAGHLPLDAAAVRRLLGSSRAGCTTCGWAPTRARTMNALGSAKRAGATLVGGDDSPVCTLSPLDGMRAAHGHHNADRAPERRGRAADVHLRCSALRPRRDATGRLAPGYAADFVVLEGDPIASGSFEGVRVAETWGDGVQVAG